MRKITLILSLVLISTLLLGCSEPTRKEFCVYNGYVASEFICSGNSEYCYGFFCYKADGDNMKTSRIITKGEWEYAGIQNINNNEEGGC